MDVQVDPEVDAKRLHQAFITAHRDATLHIAPEADHVLKHEPKTIAEIRANPQEAQDNYNADGRILDADLASSVVGWLAAHTR